MKEKMKEHLKNEYQNALLEMPKLTWIEFLQGGISLTESKGFSLAAETIREILKESI